MLQTPAGRAKYIFRTARYRASKKSLPFTLTQEWVTDKVNRGVCEATGLSFVFDLNSPSHAHPFAPSLDQRHPNAGYTPDNTQVVVFIYNQAKQDYDESVVVVMARALLRSKDE